VDAPAPRRPLPVPHDGGCGGRDRDAARAHIAPTLNVGTTRRAFELFGRVDEGRVGYVLIDLELERARHGGSSPGFPFLRHVAQVIPR
jgi:hypothetical protein